MSCSTINHEWALVRDSLVLLWMDLASVIGVRGGQEKECVLKPSWPSTAEYRMMKLKKNRLRHSP